MEDSICSSERENKWLTEEEPWVQHFCFVPNFGLDYELKIFNQAMMWLDEALNVQAGSRSFDHWAMLEDVKDGGREADTMENTSEIARNIISAARERRLFIYTAEGQLAISNARTKDFDAICRLQGCRDLVVLRGRRSNVSRAHVYKMVDKVYLASS